MKKKVTIRNILWLQAVIVIYTMSQVMAKLTALQEIFSFRFILFYGIEFLILGIYAVFWQQLIKKFDLSVAYANRAMALIWSMLWSVLIFHEGITLKKVMGVLLVILGTFIINGENKEEAENV